VSVWLNRSDALLEILVFGSSYFRILVGSGDFLGAFSGAVGVVFDCPYGFLSVKKWIVVVVFCVVFCSFVVIDRLIFDFEYLRG
jgi:hypothetical protein